MKMAVVRDRYLNPWDAGNYYGLTGDSEFELSFWGSGETVPWDDLKELYPKALFFNYESTPWEVLESEPDIIDVPDPHYRFSQYFVERHKKVVIVCWDNLPGKNTLNPAARTALHKAWKVVARSTMAAESVKLDGRDWSVEVIPGAVDTEFFRPREGEREKSALFVGRPVPEKGIFDAVFALAGLGIPLHVAGNAAEDIKNMLNLYAEKFGVELIFRGFLSRQELADAMATSLFLINPSVPVAAVDPYENWTEQFGQVFIEAMASGLPIISTQSGAIPEVVSMAGILVPPRNWHDMGRAARSLLAQDSLWHELSNVGRERAVKRYSQEVVAEMIWRFYECHLPF